MAEDSKVVVGRYRDPADVRAALQRLERDGYAREDITLYTDKSNLERIEDTQYIETLTDEGNRMDDEHRSDRSFWERVRDMVSYDDPDEGRAEDSREADFIAPFREDIRDGYTVIAVKNYKEGGEALDSTQLNRDEHSTIEPTSPVEPVDQTDQREKEPTSDAESEKIQLKEEQLDVKKEEVQTGEVHIRKETVQDTEIIEVPVEREQIVVERRPAGEAASNTVDSQTDEDDESLTIPVKEEKIIVEKEPVVTEEVEIKKKREEELETVTEDVRREEIDVDATGKVGREDTPSTDKDVDERNRRNPS